jgi:hypothetical protein
MHRRAFIGGAMALAANGPHAQDAGRRKRIAAIVTEYRENSHGDVIVTKFLEGCKILDTDFRPQVQIASLYLDQVPPQDIGKEIAERHKVPLYPTIAEALTLGGKELAVDGVLLIGEHGHYPYNELGQHMYPRRRLFEETAAVMRRSGRSVPVFNDKHLAYAWADAKWMYDTARELKIPFMAGSSLPVTWRRPDVQLPDGAEVTDALVVAYSEVESYGFHALETLQCMLERRKGGETGVRSVQCLSNEAVWKAGDEGQWDWSLLKAALARSEHPAVSGATPAQVRERSKEPEAFLIEYADGTRATVLMLSAFTEEFMFAGRLKGKPEPLTTLFWLQEPKPFGHFARLSQAIEKMFLTGRPTYPVERTLLTTGILDRVMHSRHRKGARLASPELAIRYRAR